MEYREVQRLVHPMRAETLVVEAAPHPRFGCAFALFWFAAIESPILSLWILVCLGWIVVIKPIEYAFWGSSRATKPIKMPGFIERLHLIGSRRLGTNRIRIEKGDLAVSILEIRYSGFSCQNPLSLRGIWHPDLPVVAFGVFGDLFYERIVCDTRSEDAGRCWIDEGLCSWKGCEISVASEHRVRGPVAPEIVEWALESLPCPDTYVHGKH